MQPGERNVFDQQWVASALWARHGMRCVRATLADVAARAQLAADGALRLDGSRVAVVYYRAGYSPADFPGEQEWAARLTLELSDAVNCPSAAYHLAGAKKIQQALAAPGTLERFLPDQLPAVTALRACFAGLWALDAAEGEPRQQRQAEVVAAALADPDAYVLKPQREGGGNNLYRAALADRLREGGPGLAAFILMERIRPAVQPALGMREGAVALMDALSELGVFGVFLRRGCAAHNMMETEAKRGRVHYFGPVLPPNNALIYAATRCATHDARASREEVQVNLILKPRYAERRCRSTARWATFFAPSLQPATRAAWLRASPSWTALTYSSV